MPRLIRVGFTRVPCASPHAVIHMELSTMEPGEEAVIEAPEGLADEVREALSELGGLVEVLREERGSGVYRAWVRLAPQPATGSGL